MIEFFHRCKIINCNFKNLITNKYQFIFILLISFICTLLITIPLKLTVAKIQNPQPQGILILGGSHARESFSAQFAHLYPTIPIWLSSGPDDAISHQIFLNNNISLDRVYFDNRATDTVSNFTTLVDDFKRKKIKHLYIVTSDYHISRASAIATIVLGSKGIAFSPVGVPENREPEPTFKTIRDTFRAIVWVITGYTGSSLKAV